MSTNDLVTIGTISHLNTLISLEGASQVASAGLKSKLSSLFGSMDNLIEKYLSKFDATFGLGGYVYTPNFYNGVLYTEIMDMEVPVPMGLNVPWLKYVQQLEVAETHARVIIKDVLKPFSAYIAERVNMPDKMINKSDFFSLNIPKNYEKTATDLAKSLSGNRDTRRISDCISNITEMSKVESILNDLNIKYKEYKVDDVYALYSDISDDMENVIASLSHNDISGATAKSISNATIDVAKFLEFYANYCWQLESMSNAVKATKELIKK